MPQIIQIICVGVGVLVLVTIVIQQIVVFRYRRIQKNDPLRYLRGKSREEIRQILNTPVYTSLPKTRSNPKNKTDRMD